MSGIYAKESKYTIDELPENRYYPKKRFGQNFFSNISLRNKIAADLLSNDPEVIIEIGPGLGAFTEPLYDYTSAHGKKFIGIEVDNDIVQLLLKKFPQIDIKHQDVLEIDWDAFSVDNRLPVKTIIFGALPYNISKPIIHNLVDWGGFQKGYFIIQREVANRYLATQPPTGMLALLSQIKSDIKGGLVIGPSNFTPAPKVDSRLIVVTPRAMGKNDPYNKEKLEELVKASFTNPRKTLGNNLKEKYPKIVDTAQVSLRPHQLVLDDYIKLYSAIID